MEKTKPENWSLNKIATALKTKDVDKVKIEIPYFQRNLVWSKEQKKVFIDSVKRGFPIGTLLFYNDKKQNTYRLIDGLQRSSTIREFVEKPSKYFGFEDVKEQTLIELYELFESKVEKNKFIEELRNFIEGYVTERDINSVKILNDLSTILISKYNNAEESMDLLAKTSNILAPTIDEYIESITSITNTKMPVMIYSGEESDLPTVFERINNQGTQLSKYQIYAAMWAAAKDSLVVENDEIVNFIVKKYDDFQDEDYVIQGYNKDEMLETKTLSYFEYALGFGKYISEQYENLFAKDKTIQDINQAGFELLNACFGMPNKEIKNLNLKLREVDVNLLEKKVIEVIDYVDGLLKPYIEFKGNTRSRNKLFHAQNQIISIIATAFREKYDMKDLGHEKVSWKEKERILSKNIPQHYVFDIIAKNWAEGGFGKIYSYLQDNKYLNSISKTLWDAKLEDWFSDQSSREERRNVANPKTTDKLFLNCIYVDIFSAKDHLSKDKYDIEHIVTKDMVKQLIKQYDWPGLPVSSIGNLCYLPEYDNRSKGPNIIYQDEKYLNKLKEKGMDISQIEDKYTFTKKEMLKWTEKKFKKDDFEEFKTEYLKFIRNHFDIMKEKFYKEFNIK